MNISNSSRLSTGSNRSKRSNTSGRARNGNRSIMAVSRSPVYVDDAALNAMVANLESFGSTGYQFSPAARAFGSGRMPYQSTPGMIGAMPQHETFGSQIDYNLSYMPQEFDYSTVVEQPSVYRSAPTNYFATEFLLTDVENEEEAEAAPTGKQESIIEWFDRSVEDELRRRRSPDVKSGIKDPTLEIPGFQKPCSKLIKQHPIVSKVVPAMDRLAEAAASRVEIAGAMRAHPDTELSDAVEKLAKAEAMCTFAGMVQAAEEASKSVPAEYAEVAAAAGAKCFHAEVTNIVAQNLPGEHPIEVVGYIGVTKPKVPKKPNV